MSPYRSLDNLLLKATHSLVYVARNHSHLPVLRRRNGSRRSETVAIEDFLCRLVDLLSCLLLAQQIAEEVLFGGAVLEDA